MNIQLVKTALLLTIAFAACEHSIKREDVEYTTDDTLVELARDVEVLYSDSSIVRVRVTAPVLKNYVERGNPRQEFPEGVKVEFLNEYQKVENTLTAKIGIRNPEKGIIIARDSVVMQSIKQERLETEELTWDEKTAKIHTDKFVKITKPGEVIYGFGLDAEQDFSYWKILVPKGRIKADQIDEAAK